VAKPSVAIAQHQADKQALRSQHSAKVTARKNELRHIKRM
jgi:hypothetical protein